MHTTTTFYKAPRYLFRKLNILKLLENIEYESFLDVGCGAGELACTIAQNGKKGLGTDFSEKAIAVANSLKHKRGISDENLRFLVGDGLEKSRGSYDLVICCEVLEHVEDDKKLLTKLVDKSGRYLLISVPAKMRLYDESDESVGHFRRYEKDELVNLLGSVNLEILQLINYGYPTTNVVRLFRKSLFRLRLKKRTGTSPEELSKDSGINPVLPSKILTKIDLEKIILPLFWLSLLFNKTDLGEGYLVVCEKKTRKSGGKSEE